MLMIKEEQNDILCYAGVMPSLYLRRYMYKEFYSGLVKCRSIVTVDVQEAKNLNDSHSELRVPCA